MGRDGAIYCPPSDASKVLKIDPEAGTAELIGPDLGKKGAQWAGGAMGKDGAIYCPPANASKVLKIDPQAGTVEFIGPDLGEQEKNWAGAAMGQDGAIYCPPMCDSKASKVLKIDPETGTAELIGPKFESQRGWWGAAMGQDGSIYCPPMCYNGESRVLKIDPEAGTAELIGPVWPKCAFAMGSWAAAVTELIGLDFGNDKDRRCAAGTAGQTIEARMCLLEKRMEALEGKMTEVPNGEVQMAETIANSTQPANLQSSWRSEIEEKLNKFEVMLMEQMEQAEALRLELKLKRRAQHYPDLVQALDAIDAIGKEIQNGAAFNPPACLPSAGAIMHLLKDPEINIVKDMGRFEQGLRAGLAYMQEYMTIVRGRCAKEVLEAQLSAGDGSAFQGAYEAILNLIKTKEKRTFEEYQNLFTQLKAQEKEYPKILEQISDVVRRHMELYVTAHVFKAEFFEPLLSRIDVGEIRIAALKHPFRVLEKEVLRPGQGVPWDIVRGQVVCKSMSEIISVLRKLFSCEGMILFRLNDRFGSPQNGWADCAVYVASTDPRFKCCVGEIQIVHNSLMLVREEMGAHISYNEHRFTAEVLKYFYGEETVELPWSVHNKDALRAELQSLKVQIFHQT
eukprot:gnl/MRDRNA2_/MRDRNA2_80918_c0_seq1.p1 gnl/MRDRNA2_/MRDRNA2_80918_c0~~gnl/MRDRNA2_/MRDRNA2_80918_c0_seq1.p1  ORF type:complete len:650 (-),score=119.96 gnl/MRDRNA2_/MRDRNA2_80918_c0_seq1:302-2167(-)